ncbi:bifunctional folylpolyglutamate synthase/dihydrofolate synthase [Maribacter algarum]|uniref:Dihydrofolate synthase/folylpolyglutamate synthase n=1 Tax=Maribacter algarum (ex Zhang et al. 2020) TaxID=2578118 RepID=A0A5S3PP93_9FLAO|nr:folylpolyglutamate synthase/dihydrofolate synthase family protein [Maribacter algarum]TMM56309.1 bifunctional folylpolyglutamate synthase/dihydrofolate synthase [Maribacter algarum]
MTYKATLEWMFGQLPMYQKLGKNALNHKLDKILLFSQHLGSPEKKFKSIHVAGTNGKGSSSHMLASILQEAGYKVGLYTSPHLKDFRERIRINGKTIGKKFVVDFISKNNSFFEDNKLSFFEMTVGMAFDYFAKKKVDIAIIEVGLGGRFDSTNIITPEVSLITNIGMDHTDILGDTLGKIAFEKAGIIKEGVPVIISEYQEEIAEVFQEMAKIKKSKLVFARKKGITEFKTSLLGKYQSKNIKGVIGVLEALEGFSVEQRHIKSGLKNVVKNTGLLGRWQVLQDSPKMICDTAHNYEGLSLVLDQIANQIFDKLHIVLGFVKDKNLASVLLLFPKDASYYYCKPDIQRGLDAKILRDKANDFGLKGEVYDSVSNAQKAALNNAKESDFILIGGSNFVVAEVL